MFTLLVRSKAVFFHPLMIDPVFGLVPFNTGLVSSFLAPVLIFVLTKWVILGMNTQLLLLHFSRFDDGLS